MGHDWLVNAQYTWAMNGSAIVPGRMSVTDVSGILLMSLIAS